MRTHLTCRFPAIAARSGFASAFAADSLPAAKPASAGMPGERLARIG